MDLFCINCKHSQGEGVKMTCDSPNNRVTTQSREKYLVTGEVQPAIIAMRGATCTALRSAWSPEIAATVCGPDGAWYEEKQNG